MSLFLILILCIISICKACQNGTLIWSSAQRYSSNVTECFYVSNEEEIINIIQMAQNTNGSVRVTGKSHSKSSVNMMENRNGPLFMINMSESMNNIIGYNENEQTLTFEAGASLYDVTTALEVYNRSYATFASGPPLSTNFVGCMLTGSHSRGSLLSPGSTLASDVVHLRIITSNGSIIEANGTHNVDIFNAARISFGALGIITQVTVRTKPIYFATKYVDKMYTNVSENDLQQFILNNASEYVNDYNTFFARSYFYGRYFTLNDIVIFNDSYLSNASCWGQYPQSFVCSDVYYKAMSWGLPNWNKLSPLNHAPEFSMYVDAEYYEEAWIGIIEWFEQQKNENTKLYQEAMSGDISLDVRFVAADNIWMSHAFNKSAFQIGMHYLNHSEEIQYEFTHRVKEYLKNNFGPVTYHLGKQSMATFCDLEDGYPMLSEFIALREEMDPNGLFLNDFVVDKLGLCDVDRVNGCCCTETSCVGYVQNEESQTWFKENRNVIIIVLVVLVIAVLVIMIAVKCRRNKRKSHQKLNEISMQPNDYMAANEHK